MKNQSSNEHDGSYIARQRKFLFTAHPLTKQEAHYQVHTTQ
jgi:hypothetical protein